jgi:predicted negative regulator of RcsB-dependent stress response
MESVVVMVVMLVIIGCLGWAVWGRRHRDHASTAAVPPQSMPRENSALKAFVHGNTLLMEGKFAEATAAFHQARELDPKHSHVAGRLVEVERQQAARAMAPVNATS